MSLIRKIFAGGLVALAATTPLLAVPAHAATTQPLNAVAAQPLNVVAIGDSYASGEGDKGSGWTDSSCQRSVGAAPQRAASQLDSIRPVSFTSFACYGSVIEGGNPTQSLLGPNGQPSDGQLSDVDLTGSMPVDALTISIGGNDINFATIVLACMAPFNSCSTDPTVNTMVTGGLKLLGGYPNNPGELGALIKAINARTDIDNVFLTEYPDPTKGPYGIFCGSPGPYPGFGLLNFISQDDAMWAAESVIRPLNAALQSAVSMANDGGPHAVWHYVSGMYNAFYSHGFCAGAGSPDATAAATPRYVNTLSDSLVSQGDQNGTMHPNDAGQQAVAGVMYNNYLSLPLMSASVSASSAPIAESPSAFTVQARTFRNTPIAGASVLVDGNLAGHTDSSGALNLSGYVFPTAGNHTIIAQAAGYPDARAVVRAWPHGTLSTTLTDVSTVLCLDSNSSGNVYTLKCNGGNNQQWLLQPIAGYTSEYNIIDAQTVRCLDSNSNGQVYTLPCNGGNYQNWNMTPANSTPNQFQDMATQLCLDSNTSGQAYTLSCNGGDYQRWRRSP
jgi:hypothetical protein